MNWEYFQLDRERPGTALGYSEADRPRLESAVSREVAFLLSAYSSIEDRSVDVSSVAGVEEPISLRVLEFQPIILEDNTQFLVAQLPWKDDHEEIKPGLHSITHTDDEGNYLQAITVHDPSHNRYPPIYNFDGSKIELPVLQELFEILDIIMQVCIDGGDPEHQPPLDTSTFPAPPEDPVLESIGARLVGALPGLNEL